ncbi:MAG: hypothetical protein HRF42_00740 [Candidatus Brocadia sp.]|jgi:hypothetical protein
MKQLFYLLPVLALLISPSYAGDIDVFRKGSYSINLENKSIKANKGK